MMYTLCASLLSHITNKKSRINIHSRTFKRRVTHDFTMPKIQILTFLLVISALLLSIPALQVEAGKAQYSSFTFSARHTFAVPGEGAAFNTWQGSGLIRDGFASGSGFHKASFHVNGAWQVYEVHFVFTGGFRFLDSNRLLVDAVVVKSTISSFQLGASFQILLEEGEKPTQGTVSYYIPSFGQFYESGSQSPAVVVIT